MHTWATHGLLSKLGQVSHKVQWSHHSNLEEPWEKEKTDQDQETYVFEKRKAYQNVKQVFEYCDRKLPDLTEFGKAVEGLHNDENNIDNVRKYKEESLKLLSLSSN